LLEANAHFIGHGRIQARLFQFPNYPGAVASSDRADWVTGELYELTDPGVLSALDDYEGEQFERTVVAIHLDSGDALQAWVYLLRSTRG